MKRIRPIFLLCIMLLIAACEKPQQSGVGKSTSVNAVEEPSEELVSVASTPQASPLPTLAPTPSPTPTPTPTPSPTPTPAGLIGGKYPVFSYEDEPIRTETAYQSDRLSITVTRYAEHPYSVRKLVYYVADIYLQDLSSFRTAAAFGFPNRGHKNMVKLASGVNAILAVNGDYYAGKSDTLIIRNGIVYQKSLVDDRDVCILYRDGTIGVFQPQDLNLNTLDCDSIWQAWQFGPYLINADGTPRTDLINIRNDMLNPRTVLGYYEPGHYCFVVIDGRSSASVGLDFLDLAKLMVDLGCKQAYNFDGGATSQMYWNNAIYNVPCGNRGQVDILYLVEPTGGEPANEPDA